MKRRQIAGVILVLLLSGCGEDSQREPTHRDAVESDFNGDGYGDLVVANSSATVNGKYSAGYAAALRGSSQGPGLKGAQVVTQDGLGLGKAGEGGAFAAKGRSVTADLDGDGRADFISQAGRNTLFVVWGSAKGLSVAARVTGAAPVVGDFDGDGWTDLVVKGPDGNSESTARVLLGPFSREGSPRRTVPLDLTPSDPELSTGRPSTAGDVTGDGKDDLLVTWSILADEAPVARATVVYPGAADGKLVKGPRLKDAQGKDFHGAPLRTADLNKDGFADVVAGLACEMLGDPMTPEGGSQVAVVYGGPAGQSEKIEPSRITEKTAGLPVRGPFSYCTFGYDVAVGDVNADGYADVAFSVVTSTESGLGGESSVVLLRGGADGLTVEKAQAVPGGFAKMLDTNGDRAAELAVEVPEDGETWGGGEVQVLRGGPGGVDPAPMLEVKDTDLDLGPGISGATRNFGLIG